METQPVRIHADLHGPIRIAAAEDGKTVPDWISLVVRRELEKRHKPGAARS